MNILDQIDKMIEESKGEVERHSAKSIDRVDTEAYLEALEVVREGIILPFMREMHSKFLEEKRAEAESGNALDEINWNCGDKAYQEALEVYDISTYTIAVIGNYILKGFGKKTYHGYFSTEYIGEFDAYTETEARAHFDRLLARTNSKWRCDKVRTE